MKTGEDPTHRISMIDAVLGTILGLLVLAVLVAVTLELIAVAFAGPNSVARKFARSTEAFVALERHVARGGAITGYQIRF